MFIKKPIISSAFYYQLDPALLQFNHQPIVNEVLLALLATKNIQLSLRGVVSEDSNKPLLIFLHGNSTSNDIFSDQYAHFGQRFRLLGIDLLGHGGSSKISALAACTQAEKEALAAALYTPHAMIAQVKQFLLSHNFKKPAHFLTWSLGGHIAYGIATECDQLVASITSVGSPPILFSRSGFAKGFGEWFINSLLPEWVENPKVYTPEEAEIIAERIGLTKQFATFANDLQISDPLMRRHLFLRLGQYDTPTFNESGLNAEAFVRNTNLPMCLIVGESDSGINAQYYSTLAGQLRHADSAVQIIPQGTHAVFDSHPEVYYQIVDAFLAKQ